MAVTPLGVGRVWPLVDNTTPGGMVKWPNSVSVLAEAPPGGVQVVGITADELLLLSFALAMVMSPNR